MILLTSSMCAMFTLGCATMGDGRADEGLRRAAQREARLTAMRRQALAGAMNQRQWDELMEKLRRTQASLLSVGEAGHVLFDALNVQRNRPPPVAAEAKPGELKRVRQQLAEVRRELMGRRRHMTPATLRLRGLERELTERQRLLTESSQGD